MHALGFNYRITDIQCALGNSQLKKLDSFIKKRKIIANMYDDAFLSLKDVSIPMVKKGVSHSYHLYPLLIDFKNTKFSKLEFFNKMSEKGINLQVHYIPVHIQPYYTSNYNFKYGDFPVAESFYEKEFSLPIYNDLDENQVNYVIDTIFSIFKI